MRESNEILGASTIKQVKLSYATFVNTFVATKCYKNRKSPTLVSGFWAMSV